MKVIVVLIADLLKTPPALSVIKALDDLKHEVIVCTVGNSIKDYQESLKNVNHVKFELICDNYEDNISLFQKLSRMRSIRKNLWKKIDRYYDNNTLIWVLSDVSVKHLGKELLSRNYLIHFLELIEDMYYISGNPILKLDRKAYVGKAKTIIECEYNRAHITKAWWDLPKLPDVLPNKPYISINISKDAEITSSVEIKNIIKKIEGKKIVLYQGNISKERPLDGYIKAISELGNDWAFVMMLNGENPYQNIKSTNVYYIPFVAPPFHLEVTSHAYIGVLSYVPVKNSHSILNTLYCAPNKIWEYSKFGIPMISNDLPALKYLFDTKHIGYCSDRMTINSIKTTLLKIDSNYNELSANAKTFYNSYDYKRKVSEIIKKSSSK